MINRMKIKTLFPALCSRLCLAKISLIYETNAAVMKVDYYIWNILCLFTCTIIGKIRQMMVHFEYLVFFDRLTVTY